MSDQPRTQNGDLRLEVYYGAESFWLSTRKMAELFGVQVKTRLELFEEFE